MKYSPLASWTCVMEQELISQETSMFLHVKRPTLFLWELPGVTRETYRGKKVILQSKWRESQSFSQTPVWISDSLRQELKKCDLWDWLLVSPVVTVCVLRTLHWPLILQPPFQLPSGSWAPCGQDTDLALSHVVCKQIWENRISASVCCQRKTSWAEKDNRKHCPYDSFSQGLSSAHPALEDYEVNPHTLCLACPKWY